jgi:LemA protein
MALTFGTLSLIAAWLAYAFNRLVTQSNLTREAWSGIDVQLKRRHDLLPNLVQVVRAYAKHEREVLEGVTAARSAALADSAGPDLQRRENQLTQQLQSLLALAESYPQLLADRSFADLHRQLVAIEDQLQMARRYFNGCVRDLNIRVESFPSNLVAMAFDFDRRDFFELDSATERKAPLVRLTP